MRATRSYRVLPGFRLTLGLSVAYLGLIVLIPLGAVFVSTAGMGWAEFWQNVTSSRVVASYKVTFGASLGAALVNAWFGTALAWALVRYTFPGKRLVDAAIDLPFALPTAVAGISLTAVFAETGWIGKLLVPLGIEVAFTRLGVLVALIFIGIPFVVRSVQPVLAELELELEEAALSLGAGEWQTFRRVLFPPLLPALLTGFTMAFARAIGEYGSVIFISGNLPMKTEITPLLIVTKLEQYDYAGATAIASVLLVLSFVLLLAVNLLQALTRRRLALENLDE